MKAFTSKRYILGCLMLILLITGCQSVEKLFSKREAPVTKLEFENNLEIKEEQLLSILSDAKGEKEIEKFADDYQLIRNKYKEEDFSVEYIVKEEFIYDLTLILKIQGEEEMVKKNLARLLDLYKFYIEDKIDDEDWLYDKLNITLDKGEYKEGFEGFYVEFRKLDAVGMMALRIKAE